MSPSTLINLEQAWSYLPVAKLGRYETAPASVYWATLFLLKNPPVTTNLSPRSIPHACLNNVNNYTAQTSGKHHQYSYLNKTIYTNCVLYGNLKANEEEEPSAETLSAVSVLLSWPPKSRTSPDLSPQQEWLHLCPTSLTGSEVKDEIPSNFSQVLCACSPSPPQTMLLHMLCPYLAMLNLPTGQVLLLLGWNISADVKSSSRFHPPAMMIPGNIR